MKQVNTKVLKAIEQVTRREVKKELDDWPPFCMGIIHQPKRPNMPQKRSGK